MSHYQNQRVPLICCLELESAFRLKIATLPWEKKEREGQNQKENKRQIHHQNLTWKALIRVRLRFECFLHSIENEVTLRYLLMLVI